MSAPSSIVSCGLWSTAASRRVVRVVVLTLDREDQCRTVDEAGHVVLRRERIEAQHHVGASAFSVREVAVRSSRADTAMRQPQRLLVLEAS
jgi:hypothetical protein